MKLSVVAIFHGIEDYAPAMLHGLAAAAAPDIEFLLVDDASRDGTAQLLVDFAAARPDTTVIRLAENGGPSVARNAGLDRAKGRWIVLLDGDDWLAPGYLRELLAQAEELDCDFLRTDHVKVTGRKRELVRAPQGRRGVRLDPRRAIGPADRKTMVDYPFPWAGIYHRRLLDRGLLRFDPRLRTCEDREWTWRMYLGADSYAVSSLAGVHYRRDVAGSLTQVGDDRQLDFIPAFDAVLRHTSADPDADRLLPKAVRSYTAMIDFHWRNAGRLQRDVARRLRTEAAAAVGRMPRGHLDEVLVHSDPSRRALIRRLAARRANAA